MRRAHRPLACAKPPAPGDPIRGLNKAQREQFERGKAIFNQAFVPETGLGPLFNAEACGECHEDPVAGGVGDEVEVHASALLPDGFCDLLAELGGPVYQQLVPTLAEFNEGAFQIEQGVTTPAVPDEGTVGGQPIPPGVDPVPEPELDGPSVALVDAFVRFLAPPAPPKLKGAAKRGPRLLASIGCAACHVPRLKTGASDVPALAHREVAAYTDLLLHDMGPELSDICFGLAAASEFRTEPLMGLRFSRSFLHDGRAGSIEEAIRLHGGEATASRDRFAALPPEDHKALLAFLKEL